MKDQNIRENYKWSYLKASFSSNLLLRKAKIPPLQPPNPFFCFLFFSRKLLPAPLFPPSASMGSSTTSWPTIMLLVVFMQLGSMHGEGSPHSSRVLPAPPGGEIAFSPCYKKSLKKLIVLGFLKGGVQNHLEWTNKKKTKTTPFEALLLSHSNT